MREIKLSGREAAVLRAIGFALGVTGEELHETTNIDPEELHSVLTGLIDVGYVEAVPPSDAVPLEELFTTTFEVNPAYAQQLRTIVNRR